MQSSGAWTIVSPLARQQSVDSGSDVDGFSLINANPEPSETSYLDLDATWTMTLPLGNNQPSSENLHPLRPAVVDWVEEQSLHDQTSDGATELRRALVDSVPSQAAKAKQARVRTSEHAFRQEGRRRVKKVYDIPTLLKLRETQSAVPVMLRVKPEAIAGESMTMPLPRLRSDGLTLCPREHLPVYGSCNVTSTINTLSRRFRHLQHVYWKH